MVIFRISVYVIRSWLIEEVFVERFIYQSVDVFATSDSVEKRRYHVVSTASSSFVTFAPSLG